MTFIGSNSSKSDKMFSMDLGRGLKEYKDFCLADAVKEYEEWASHLAERYQVAIENAIAEIDYE